MPDESPVLPPSRMLRWLAIAAVIAFTVALYFRDGRTTALPPRENRVRSAHRGRVLLRLRGGTTLWAGGSGGDRKEDGGGREGRLPVCTRGSLPHRREAALQG